MSKRRLVILSAVVTALLAAYMGYDVCTYQTIDGTLGEFFEKYLDHMQRYIWSGMICGIPVIYSQMLWIETPELLVRMRERVFQQVLERSIVVSFLCALYVVVCHLAVAWAIGLEMNWGDTSSTSWSGCPSFICFAPCCCMCSSLWGAAGFSPC